VLMNVLFPGIILIVLLAIVLGVSAWRTLAKGMQVLAREQLGHQHQESLAAQAYSSDGRRIPLADLREVVGKMTPRVETILDEESSFPWHLFLKLVVMWCGLTVLVILRGGGSSMPNFAGIVCGSWQYWLIFAGTIMFLALAALYAVYSVQRSHHMKVEAGYPFLPSDIKWTRNNLTKWPLISVVVGFASGFVGISGGMLQGPLLLEMGVPPQVAAATTSFMVLFTSTSIAFQYMVLGLLHVGPALWFWCIGLVAAFFGQVILDAFMKRYRRQSFIAFLLAGLIVFSGASMLSMGFISIFQGGADFSFRHICNPNE